jgi:hypothetical protein
MMKKRTAEAPRLKPISLAPLTVDEALAAMLRTPPPPSDTGTRKVVKKTKRRKDVK